VIYLIEYDRHTGRLIREQEFASDQHEAAANARLTLEISNLQSKITREVVLLEANSRADLRLTHKRYFEDVEALTNSATYTVTSTSSG
jgi:hypothetical protein